LNGSLSQVTAWTFLLAALLILGMVYVVDASPALYQAVCASCRCAVCCVRCVPCAVCALPAVCHVPCALWAV
jgi:hypothetical protein